MCVPGTQETVMRRLSRREFFKAAATATMAVALGQSAVPRAHAARVEEDDHRPHTGRFNDVVDLTHVLPPDFPTYFGAQQLEIEDLFTFEEHGFNMKKWNLVEHTGTHMDAPFHFSPDQDSADRIPVSKLVLPLAVIDIRRKAQRNPDAQLTPADIHAWEARYGRIPNGSCVAMQSGWAEKVNTDAFRNADESGVMHFPGFHLEAAAFLIEERRVHGIVVDTLSLDYGPSADFAVHYLWLPSNRWGLEAVANLDRVPPRGATLVVGGPKVLGATGGPTRVLALVDRRR